MTPPVELLPDKAVGTYGGILRALGADPLTRGKDLERAVYRIASDGAFIHREIWTGASQFCFRDLQGGERETTYAIRRRLKDSESVVG